MALDKFQGFDGWKCEYRKGENSRHEFMFSKDHPKGKNGKLTVWSSVGMGSDPEIAYLVGKRDAYAEDVRVSTEDDRGIWQERYDDAVREVISGKVKRGLSKGFGRDYAVKRLSEAGFTFSDMNKFLEGKE